MTIYVKYPNIILLQLYDSVRECQPINEFVMIYGNNYPLICNRFFFLELTFIFSREKDVKRWKGVVFLEQEKAIENDKLVDSVYVINRIPIHKIWLNNGSGSCEKTHLIQYNYAIFFS